MTERGDHRQAGDRARPVIALEDSGHRASLFERSRRDRSTEITEDYVELIADLIETHGEARLVDLASHLGVSRATVSGTIARLQREGYVETRPYRAIFLTEKGRGVAGRSRERHRIVLEFLQVIGVDPAIAEADAEGIEHHVSAQTLDAIAAVTARLRPRGGR